MWPGGIECVILSWLTNHLLSATQRDTRPTTTMPRCCTAAARSTEYTRTGSTEAFRWVTPALIPPLVSAAVLWESQPFALDLEKADCRQCESGLNYKTTCGTQMVLIWGFPNASDKRSCFVSADLKKKMWTPHSFYHPSENESRWQLSEDLQLSPLSAGYFWEIGRIVSISPDFISTCCTSFWILITALSSQWNLSLWYITPTDITGYLWFPLWQGGLD